MDSTKNRDRQGKILPNDGTGQADVLYFCGTPAVRMAGSVQSSLKNHTEQYKKKRKVRNVKAEVAVYDTLPKEAIQIREEVFMREQGFQEEFDEIDGYAVHLVLFCDGFPAAVGRFYEDEEKGGYLFGRLAVRRAYRGKNLGALLLAEAEREIRKAGGRSVRLHAQRQAQPFYEKQGYTAYGETDFDEGCPHVWMKKRLEP